MRHGACPVCGTALRGRGEALATRWISVFSCPRCGRFTADDEVIERLERADDAERAALSTRLASAPRRRAVALRLPPR